MEMMMKTLQLADVPLETLVPTNPWDCLRLSS